MLNISEQKEGNSALKITKSRTLTLSALALGAALSLTACGGDDHHEPAAVDKVEEAAEIARANAPEPEIIESETTSAETEAVAEEAVESDTETETETSEESEVSEPAESEAEAETTAGSELSASAGKDLYESTCKACHETGLLNAPKLGDTTAWAPRIEKGMDTLHKHSAEGFNQMPAQAVNGVSEEQVAAAVDYMVEQSS